MTATKWPVQVHGEGTAGGFLHEGGGGFTPTNYREQVAAELQEMDAEQIVEFANAFTEYVHIVAAWSVPIAETLIRAELDRRYKPGEGRRH